MEIPLKKITYRQEFLYRARPDAEVEIWHLVGDKDPRKRPQGRREVCIKNRHGSTLWIDWDTEVELCPHSSG
jgi:hypothetical protein